MYNHRHAQRNQIEGQQLGRYPVLTSWGARQRCAFPLPVHTASLHCWLQSSRACRRVPLAGSRSWVNSCPAALTS